MPYMYYEPLFSVRIYSKTKDGRRFLSCIKEYDRKYINYLERNELILPNPQIREGRYLIDKEKEDRYLNWYSLPWYKKIFKQEPWKPISLEIKEEKSNA